MCPGMGWPEATVAPWIPGLAPEDGGGVGEARDRGHEPGLVRDLVPRRRSTIYRIPLTALVLVLALVPDPEAATTSLHLLPIFDLETPAPTQTKTVKGSLEPLVPRSLSRRAVTAKRVHGSWFYLWIICFAPYPDILIL